MGKKLGLVRIRDRANGWSQDPPTHLLQCTACDLTVLDPASPWTEGRWFETSYVRKELQKEKIISSQEETIQNQWDFPLTQGNLRHVPTVARFNMN